MLGKLKLIIHEDFIQTVDDLQLYLKLIQRVNALNEIYNSILRTKPVYCFILQLFSGAFSLQKKIRFCGKEYEKYFF